jgi:hypothetical protein
MSETVARLHNLTKLELNPDMVLEAAKGQVNEVLVLGWEEADGSFYFAASDADLSRASMLLLRALRHVTESMQ